jgi:hypothetical protein
MVLETATIIFEPMARGESKKMQVKNHQTNHRRELGMTLSRNLRTEESSVRANRNRTNSMGERVGGLLDGVGATMSMLFIGNKLMAYIPYTLLDNVCTTKGDNATALLVSHRPGIFTL